jgi:hypothetical protein
MGNDNSPENFAKQKRAAIVAPAGYGKTELIVQSVACSEGRQLVLTHTHAGVDSLRKRFKKYNISSSKYSVETIHSFALKYASAYPKTTGLPFEKPQENEDYNQVISSAVNLFDIKFGKDILRSSYKGIYVDEYQDCGMNQHVLIRKLADVLHCRIVGDPMQSIYDFGNNQVVDWESHVKPYFDPLPDLTIPHRWNKTNPELGNRLKEVRHIIDSKNQINFKYIINDSSKEIFKYLKYTDFGKNKVYVICSPENEYYPHSLTENLGNKFSSIEPLTSEKLCKDAKEIESCCENRLEKVIEFAIKCLTEISKDCNRVISYKRGNLSERQTKLREYFHSIQSFNKLEDVYKLFVFFDEAYDPTYKRKQLWYEMKKGLHEVITGSFDSLEEAVWHVRNQLRFKENRIPRRCISRTVLLKGLECDHAIIIKPELFDEKNLYVALTRASSKLTIISNSNTWNNYENQ